MSDAFDTTGDAAKLKAFLEKRKQQKEQQETAEPAPVAMPEPEVKLAEEERELPVKPSVMPKVDLASTSDMDDPFGVKEPSEAALQPEPKQPTVNPEFVEDTESDADKESRLKAMLQKRRADKNKVVSNEDDPYEGDMMARKYLSGLQKYLDRPDIADIKEVVINRPEEVGLEYADGHWEWIKDPEMTQDYLEDMARMLANRSGQLFHPGNPILSVKMPGGHRVQIVAGFNAPSGFIFAMRLQRKEKFTLEDFVMDADEREKVRELCRTQQTMIISGGTGTGKTSFLNALIPSIPEHERLITMEDVAELRIPHKNWAQMLFGGNDTTVGDQGVIALLNACLRLRPDRIILGEIRKENAFAFCSAINTGHEGSLATIHANTPKMAIDAVLNRVMMNGDMPDSAINVLRRQLLEDVKAVVQLTRVGNKVEAYLKKLDPEDKELQA